MKTRGSSLAWAVLVGALLAPACSYIGARGSPTPQPSDPVAATVAALAALAAAPDPCAAADLPAQVQALNALTRKFDDAAAIARNSKQEAIASDIATLQSIRRDAEQLPVPACLNRLKDVQLVYMNTFIQTLLGFQSGAGTDQVTQGITVAGQLHDQYMIAMMGVLGQPAASLPKTAPSAAPAEGANATPPPSVPVITNPGPDTARVFTRPAPDAQSVGALAAGQTALALAQTSDGAWVMIEIPGWPGQTAWVNAAAVQWSGPGNPPIVPAP
jgi:hypothetical protein